jgi:hypothetical protein
VKFGKIVQIQVSHFLQVTADQTAKQQLCLEQNGALAQKIKLLEKS